MEEQNARISGRGKSKEGSLRQRNNTRIALLEFRDFSYGKPEVLEEEVAYSLGRNWG